MSHIQVLVAATSLDMTAEGISAAIAQREDMTLIEDRIVGLAEVGRLLDEMPLPVNCAVILVGPHAETEDKHLILACAAQGARGAARRHSGRPGSLSRRGTSEWIRCSPRCRSLSTAPGFRPANASRNFSFVQRPDRARLASPRRYRGKGGRCYCRHRVGPCGAESSRSIDWRARAAICPA